MVEASLILQEIEQMGKLELVKYNFKEIFDYKRLSEGKVIGNSLLRNYDYTPDLNLILVATGEAVGCIDLQKIESPDISIAGDSLIILLPPPELCYYKLNMDKTRIFSFEQKSWWSKLFSDEYEQNAVIQEAYRLAEKKIEEAAYEADILHSTNEQAKNMLEAMFEGMTGKKVLILTSIPEKEIEYNRY